MAANEQTIIDLEKRFWQSMVDEKTDVALALIAEPSMMVSGHGAMQFDHAAYRKMAEQGTMVVKAYALSDAKVTFVTEDVAILTYGVHQTVAMRGKPQAIEQDMFDTSTWVRKNGEWKCVLHTEAEKTQPKG